MRTRFRRSSTHRTTLQALVTCGLSGLLACSGVHVWQPVGAVRGELRVLHEEQGDPEHLGGTVVYLDGVGAPAYGPSSDMSALIFGTSGRIEPVLLAGHPGQRVLLRFAGDVLHQPFTDASEGEVDPFESSADGTLMLRLDSPGVVRVYCSLHGSERAVVFVSRSPYHDVVDSGGQYAIADVPVGNYQLSIWSEDVQGSIRPIEVHRGSELESTIWIDARKIAR